MGLLALAHNILSESPSLNSSSSSCALPTYAPIMMIPALAHHRCYWSFVNFNRLCRICGGSLPAALHGVGATRTAQLQLEANSKPDQTPILSRTSVTVSAPE
jgi:hypothetical protein